MDIMSSVLSAWETNDSKAISYIAESIDLSIERLLERRGGNVFQDIESIHIIIRQATTGCLSDDIMTIMAFVMGLRCNRDRARTQSSGFLRSFAVPIDDSDESSSSNGSHSKASSLGRPHHISGDRRVSDRVEGLRA